MALRFAKLTRPNIRALRPGEKITEHGISAEGLANGDIRYSVNIMATGERVHRVVGLDSDGVTRTQAEEFTEKVRTEAREGRLSLPKGRQTPLTFRKAAKVYLAGQREIDAKNIELKERHLRLHLVPYFGSMRVEKITAFTLEKFRKQCKANGLSIATTNRVLATYRHMARQLLERGKLRAPMPMIKLVKEDNRRDYVLYEDDIDRLLDAALKDSNSYIWLFIVMGLNTSLRHHEILSARFEDLKVKKRRLGVQVKGGKWREQPLTQDITKILADELDMADDPDGWVFPNPASKSGHYESMKKPFRRVVLTAGLDPRKVVPHTLRHSAITHLAETGTEIQNVQAFSGHRSLQMVMRYIHARDEKVDAAIDKLDISGTNRVRAPARKRRKS